jgi:hypothetical protein
VTQLGNDGSSSAYRPGVCNIGPAEIARRRRSAVAATLVALAVAAGLVVSGIPAPARILLWPFAAATAISWLQVVRRFCVAFGAVGILNFHEPGATTAVVDAAARAADRRTVIRMVLEGGAYGLVAALLLVML